MEFVAQARLLDTVRRLIRRNARSRLERVIQKTQPADVAHLLPRLSEHDAKIFLKVLSRDEEHAAEVLSNLEEDTAPELLPLMETDSLASIFTHLHSDDAADLLRALPEELAEGILKRMKGEEAADVEELLHYDPKTAGGIMGTDFFSLNRDLKAGDAIFALQEAEDAEMVFYVYCTNDEGHLVGVLSLRDLLTHPAETPLDDIMNADVIKVSPDTDQERVARLVARYDLLAIPVVDEFNKLLGIVTVDDIIDVVRDEATEDFLKMVGSGEENVLDSSTARSAWLRAPWMLLAAIGGIGGAALITGFRERLEEVVLLAAFIPVVMGMGGNVGIQSATIMVRGLATGRVDMLGQGKILAKEVRTGVLLAVAGSLVVGTAAYLLGHMDYMLGLVVGAAILTNMVSAALLGSMVPLIFRKLAVDPAVATGPIMTTFMDVAGILIYFVIAARLLSL
ncbi:MAG: magnesium transporter [Deltaproteobacteria bacterium]|jgi:magnesium transporter|nr:magnesium transporter [Deltaproteobacteria bacterium]MBW2533322.1 magnesium transporter [Deltaproteobacteria bacterium]